MQDAPYSYLKAIPEGYGVAVMYTSARNHLNPYIPTVSFAFENYWPVEIRQYSNGKTKFIYIHEDKKPEPVKGLETAKLRLRT